MKTATVSIQFECPSCGQEIDAEPSLFGKEGKCPRCKTKLIVPCKCPSCGGAVLDGARRCTHCLEELGGRRNGTEKKILPALLLWFFLGSLGAHAFYAGRLRRGFFYLLTPPCLLLFLIASDEENPGLMLVFLLPVAVFGIMLLVDFVRIITGSFEDGQGNAISNWT